MNILFDIYRIIYFVNCTKVQSKNENKMRERMKETERNGTKRYNRNHHRLHCSLCANFYPYSNTFYILYRFLQFRFPFFHSSSFLFKLYFSFQLNVNHSAIYMLHRYNLFFFPISLFFLFLFLTCVQAKFHHRNTIQTKEKKTK